MIRIVFFCTAALAAANSHGDPEKLLYGDPALVVDLGVGLWAQPLPMDWDRDGDPDLVVATADVSEFMGDDGGHLILAKFVEQPFRQQHDAPANRPNHRRDARIHQSDSRAASYPKLLRQ